MTDRLEKLCIVLTMKSQAKAEIVIADTKIAPLVVEDSFTCEPILQSILDTMDGLSIPLDFRLSDGTSVTQSEIKEQVHRYGKLKTMIETDSLRFQISLLPAWQICVVSVEEKKMRGSVSWDHWVAPFLPDSKFIQAWISDVEFDYWQNATDPLEYTSSNRNYSHLPLKSNGLPFPLEQNIIDISANPGRTEFKSGYVEAVGARMWLTSGLWRAVGCTDYAMLSEVEWISKKIVNDNVVEISIGEELCSESEVCHYFNRLRKLLYDSR